MEVAFVAAASANELEAIDPENPFDRSCPAPIVWVGLVVVPRLKETRSS
jgi:hypothetical protein